MEDIHIKTRDKKDSINAINDIRKRVYDDYMCDLNDCNLDIENERLYINSLKDKQNNPLFTGVLASVVGVVVGIILPPFFQLFSKSTESIHFSLASLIAFVLAFIVILIFLGIVFACYYLIIIKDIFNFYKRYLKKNTYYSICLEVLDEIEKEIKLREKESV
ncbi:hypothetical protein QYB59_000003 [Clostridium perfringens]|nr:hypothetical protein [Clostridium perfringens]